MRIFITAVTSYLGSSLKRYLAVRGHTVTGSDRRSIELGRPFDAGLFNGQDVAVHCAHDFSPNAASLNIEGTKAIFEGARQQGVLRQVLVSSYSAKPTAVTEYGRIKYELEDYFLNNDQIVVRPGLVIGNGGLFGRNMRTILATPVLPLADRGMDPIAFVGIQDFVQAMSGVIEKATPGAYNLFHPEVVTLRTLSETLYRRAGHRALYLNVPARFALFLLSAAAAVGIRLPVHVANLKALKQNRDCPYKSDLRAFVPQLTSLHAAVESALADLRGDRDGR